MCLFFNKVEISLIVFEVKASLWLKLLPLLGVISDDHSKMTTILMHGLSKSSQCHDH